jgi:DNA-binding response OmpR family regulator
VEDEAMIALDLAELMSEHGAEIVGPAGSVEEAFRAIEGRNIHAALLDVTLSEGHPVSVLASALVAWDVPIVFLTGTDLDSLPVEHRSCPTIQKPYDSRTVVNMLATILGRSHTPQGVDAKSADELTIDRFSDSPTGRAHRHVRG